MLDLSQLLLAAEVLLRSETLPGTPREVLRSTLQYCESQSFVHVRGDLEIAGDLPLDWDAPLWNGADVCGVFVEGDLRVSGRMTNFALSGGPTLIVLGNVEAGRVVQGGSTWLIHGDLRVRDTLFGYYNDGYVFVGGDLSASAVVSYDHHISVAGTTTGTWIDNRRGQTWLADGLYDEEFDEVDWEAVVERSRRDEPLVRSEPRTTSAADP